MNKIERFSEHSDKNILLYTDTRRFVLFDSESDKVYAYLNVGRDYDVTSIAAERGYGTYITKIAMMYLNPKGLFPSRDGDIRSDAFSIWEKMYKDYNISKIPLSIRDNKFNFAILDGEEFHGTFKHKKEYYKELIEDSEYEEALKVFNCEYLMKPNDDFNSIVDKSPKWSNENERELILEVINKGNNYFTIRYGE